MNKTDVNKVFEKYNKELLCILNKHAHEKCKKFAVRDMREWMTEEVHSIKRAKRKSECVWRKSKLIVDRLIFKEHCLKLKVAITKARTHHYQQGILDCNNDQSKLFKCVKSLLGRSKQCALLPDDSPASLSTHFMYKMYLLILMIILLRKLKPLGKSFLFYNQLYLIMFVPNLAQRVSQQTVNF